MKHSVWIVGLLCLMAARGVSAQDTIKAPTPAPTAAVETTAQPAPQPAVPSAIPAVVAETTATPTAPLPMATEPVVPPEPAVPVHAAKPNGQQDTSGTPAATPDAGRPGWKAFFTRPVPAFFSSLLLPGTGEFMNGKEIWGYVSLGAEAALWITYAVMISDHNSKEKAYQEYAGQHWDVGDYNSIVVSDPTFFVEELPTKYNESYYDMITHEQFCFGWDDSPLAFSVDSARVTGNQRALKNKINAAGAAYDRASYTRGAVILNHVLSAINAYRFAKRNPANAPKVSMQYELRPGRGVETPYVVLSYKF